MTSPEPDTDLSLTFLDGLDPAGRQDLFAIHPTLPEKAPGKTEAATFLPDQRAEMRAWIDKHQGKYNIYTSVNRARADAPKNIRLRKEHIGHIQAIVADIDATKVDVHAGGDPSGENFGRERARLQIVAQELADDPICPPTLMVDSGGGLQLWWQLAAIMPATAANVALVEGIGRTLAKNYSGDSVFDIARIMRVPGTINIPTAIKSAQGRTPALAAVLGEQSSAETYALEKLAEWAPPTPEKANPKDRPKSPIDWDAVEAQIYEDLPAELREKFEAYCAERPQVGALWNGAPWPRQSDLSPSGFVFALADALRRSGTFTATEFAQLVAVWDQRSVQHADEFERYVSRAWNRNRAPLGGQDFEDESKAPSSKRTEMPGSTAQQIEWAEPADLWAARFEAVDLPVGAVPHVIECVAHDQARRLGVEAGACAAALLTSIGSLVPAGNQMQMRQRDPDWKVKPILWTALIGEPGTNKSGIFKYATDPVDRVESKWARQYAIERRDYERQNAAKQPTAKTAVKANEANAALEPPPSNSPEDWLEAAREPAMRRKVVQDATTEQLSVILSQNKDGLLFKMDELSGFFGSMDLYRNRGGKDRPFWLQAKDGGVSIVDRRSHGTLRAENTAISVLGGIQPAKIRALGAGLAEDGTLQRFLPITVKKLGRGEDVEANKAYAATLDQIAEALVDSEREGVFKFSPEGDRELSALYDFQEPEMKRPGASPAFRQWLEKMPNEFGRLALVFHFIEWHASAEAAAAGSSSPPSLVSGATACRARRFLTEFAYPHALVFHQSVLGRSEYEEHTGWIGGFILARGLSVVCLRDVYKNYGPFKRPEARRVLPDIMHALETEDWLYPCPGRHKKGRPTRWFVNPAVHEAFAEGPPRSARRGRRRKAASVKKARDGEPRFRPSPKRHGALLCKRKCLPLSPNCWHRRIVRGECVSACLQF